ncbi:MAG: hypothetical protein ABI876_04160 [Bacteroidota bacterium]
MESTTFGGGHSIETIMNDIDEYMHRRLLMYLQPLPVPIEGEPGRKRMYWIIRVRSLLPGTLELKSMTEEIELHISKTWKEAYGEYASDEKLYASRVSANFIRVADYHLAVEIDLPETNVAVGGIDMIGIWMVLGEVKRRLGIEELQGVPAKFWVPLGWYYREEGENDEPLS